MTVLEGQSRQVGVKTKPKYPDNVYVFLDFLSFLMICDLFLNLSL